MAAVNDEVARGRRRLSEQLFSASLASDLGSWLLLHAEGVAVVWFPGLVGDNGGQRWSVTWSSVAAKSEAEQKRHRRRKGRGREPSTTLDKVHPRMGSGGDRRLHTLRRERGHHAMTRSVVNGAGPATSACG
jgi:hypothetical protein